MELGSGRTLTLVCGFAFSLASAGAALAEDAKPREDGLPPLEAVDQATLEQQSGTLPVAGGDGGTMLLPGAGSGIPGPDQSSFSSSHGSIASSAVSSSSLSATTAGGVVAVGQ